MTTREFEAGGRKFQLVKIDAMKQFHIMRRIGPILADMVQGFQSITKAKDEKLSEEQMLAAFGKLAEPVMGGLAKLPDADADFVLMSLLSSVEVYQAQFSNWSRISNGTSIAMQDIELPILLQAAGKALMYNLSGFFALLPRKS